MNIREKYSAGKIISDITNLNIFFNYLETEHNLILLEKITRLLIEDFERYLLSSDKYKKATKENFYGSMNSFFRVMEGWENMPLKNPTTGSNPFNRSKQDRLIAKKYIPDYVTNQLDQLFKDERLPLHIRLAYWILRSIPSRVSEVLGMKINCLKPYIKEGQYVIFIPTWKQAGGHFQPELKSIHVKDTGHGGYLIKMIREQKKIATSLQCNLEEKSKDMLFTYKTAKISHYHFKNSGDIVYETIKSTNAIKICNVTILKQNFNNLCARFNIKDEKGKPYFFTTHQLRHKGITDRIYEGFSVLEVRDMTGHKGNQMIETSYIHPDPEKIKHAQDKTFNNTNNNQVYFKGRILNMNQEQEKRLLQNLRAHRIGKLGICADISSCNFYECIECNKFIPNAEELDYFLNEVKVWTEKVEQFKNHYKMRENAEYNLKLNQAIVDKIKHNIERDSK